MSEANRAFQFTPWRLIWATSLCASVVWLFTISPMPENCGLDGHQRAFASLMDGAARLAICSLIFVMPTALRDSKRGERKKWHGLTAVEILVGAMFVPPVAIQVLVHVTRILPPN